MNQSSHQKEPDAINSDSTTSSAEASVPGITIALNITAELALREGQVTNVTIPLSSFAEADCKDKDAIACLVMKKAAQSALLSLEKNKEIKPQEVVIPVPQTMQPSQPLPSSMVPSVQIKLNSTVKNDAATVPPVAESTQPSPAKVKQLKLDPYSPLNSRTTFNITVPDNINVTSTEMNITVETINGSVIPKKAEAPKVIVVDPFDLGGAPKPSDPPVSQKKVELEKGLEEKQTELKRLEETRRQLESQLRDQEDETSLKVVEQKEQLAKEEVEQAEKELRTEKEKLEKAQQEREKQVVIQEEKKITASVLKDKLEISKVTKPADNVPAPQEAQPVATSASSTSPPKLIVPLQEVKKESADKTQETKKVITAPIQVKPVIVPVVKEAVPPVVAQPQDVKRQSADVVEVKKIEATAAPVKVNAPVEPTPVVVVPTEVKKSNEEAKQKLIKDPSKPVVIKKANGEAKIIMPKVKSDQVQKKENEVQQIDDKIQQKVEELKKLQEDKKVKQDEKVKTEQEEQKQAKEVIENAFKEASLSNGTASDRADDIEVVTTPTKQKPIADFDDDEIDETISPKPGFMREYSKAINKELLTVGENHLRIPKTKFPQLGQRELIVGLAPPIKKAAKPEDPLKTTASYRNAFKFAHLAMNEFAQNQLEQLAIYEKDMVQQPKNQNAFNTFVQAAAEVRANLKGHYGTLWVEPKSLIKEHWDKPVDPVTIAPHDEWKEQVMSDQSLNVVRRFSDETNDNDFMIPLPPTESAQNTINEVEKEPTKAERLAQAWEMAMDEATQDVDHHVTLMKSPVHEEKVQSILAKIKQDQIMKEQEKEAQQRLREAQENAAMPSFDISDIREQIALKDFATDHLATTEVEI